jgi:hypothetical protein
MEDEAYRNEYDALEVEFASASVISTPSNALTAGKRKKQREQHQANPHKQGL